jgi:hypothetical protein
LYCNPSCCPLARQLLHHPYKLKLSAVEWACNKYVKGKKDGDLDVLITRYTAAKRLGITSTMLRNWTRNKLCIAN